MGSADKRNPTPRHAKPTMRRVERKRPPKRGKAVRGRDDRATSGAPARGTGGNGRVEMGDFGFSGRTGTVLYVAMGIVMVAAIGYCVYVFFTG